MNLEKEIKELKDTFLTELSSCKSAEELKTLRTKYLGRKGIITQKLHSIKTLPPEEKPIYGKQYNILKGEIEKELSAKTQLFSKKENPTKFFDWTLPGDRKQGGHYHPLTVTMKEIIDVFLKMGFSVEYGPEVESEFYNFEALNMPKDHPSRDIQDTFYLGNDLLLRTQTSPVQIRVMQKKQPPIRIISPGRCYRVDNFDASHSPVFHQIECLYVDKNVTLSDLTGTLDTFAKAIFGPSTKTKFVPHYFPFTEPSAEVHVSCPFCNGKGCSTCKQTGWIEILGCGMVHPKVFRNVGYNPDNVTGYAFGMGIERICMIKYGINDMRLFYDNDLRFLRQF
ncbi:MAG: phenylalanine--tRNA ligase subunit alpha [Candidatus Cloacimonas sp. 4484_209]|nr:MAG: phenylalanine--tRNA ligase subunit alpha [Candidatus Cloacimonas sp. 4484_209]